MGTSGKVSNKMIKERLQHIHNARSLKSARHEIRDAIMVSAREYAVLKHERTQRPGHE